MKNAGEVFFSPKVWSRHRAAIRIFGREKTSRTKFVVMDTANEFLQSSITEERFPVRSADD